MKNQLFRNTGTGRFVETSAAAGPAFARAEISRGAAFGDLDNDGDVDIVVTNNGGPVRLLINQTAGSAPDARNHWLQIRVSQESSNRFGIGAWVGVERAGRPTLWQRVRTDGSYLSASDVRVHFGLGASPAVDASFVADRPHDLQPLAEGTFGRPHATSLRMGRLGYQSNAQAALAVSYNCLESYAASLHEAMVRPYPAYEAIGVRGDDGEYRQLCTTLLQIENEFYGTIRPKRVINKGERPLHALRERGVEYIEVRCMDLDPFVPIGIAPATARFLDVFLLHCLLADSPPDTPVECAALARNQEAVSARGREPGLRLERDGREVSLIEWGQELFDEFVPIAALLDARLGGTAHHEALEVARAALSDPNTLPSARVRAAMAAGFAGSHLDFVRSCSEAAREAVLALAWSDTDAAHYHALAEASRREQAAVEASDPLSFEAFRQHYLSPLQLQP